MIFGHGKPTRIKGFTLVELMAVMACVSLLLTILLPSLTAARAAAYRVISAGNQRTLGQGIVMFAGGKRGRIPPSRVLIEDPLDLAELMRVYEPTFGNFVGTEGGDAVAQLTPGDVYRNRYAIDTCDVRLGWIGPLVLRWLRHRAKRVLQPEPQR